MKYNKHIYVVLLVALVLLGCKSPVDGNGKLPVKLVQASGGGYHTVALTDTGQLYAWGSNDDGQLGNGKSDSSKKETEPQPVSLPEGVTSKKWTKVSAGSLHTVALTDTGKLYAWGRNISGQLGNGNNDNKNTPQSITVTGVTQWTQVSASRYHTVALTDTGQLYAWGRNVEGQLGNGESGTSVKTKTTPQPVDLPTSATGSTQWTRVSAGDRHTVALSKAGQLYAWGHNGSGQLGNGESGASANKTTPQLISLPK